MALDAQREAGNGHFARGNRLSARHTPAHQAAVAGLADIEGTTRAAEVSGVPRRTVRRWAARALVIPDGSHPVGATERELARKLLAEECERLMRRYMVHLDLDRVVDLSSARDAATVVGILADKAIKFRGEDRPDPLQSPLTLGDYMLSLAAQAKGRAEAT